MKKIVINPIAGLCNRMRFISSAIYVGYESNRKIVINWNKANNCAFEFEDLFEPINLPNVRFCKNVAEKILYRTDGPKTFNCFTLLRNILGYQQFCNYDYDREEIGIEKIIKPTKDVYIQSFFSVSRHYSLSKIFKPISEVQSKINKVTAKFNSYTIGIHIRRTDHKDAIAFSSISDYEKMMMREVKSCSSTNFYLATDDEDVKHSLMKKFGDKIICYSAPLTRESVEGMKAALVDLYCLSKTTKIYGSKGSSYSEIAAELGNIDLLYR